MSLLQPKPATYADIEALPPNVVGEILFGSLITHPRPATRHIFAASAMGGVLNPPFQFGSGGPGGWVIMDEPELHLGPHVVVPDLAGWRSEKFAGGEDVPWIGVSPDWICEVLSASTEIYDRGDKRRIYATYSVPYLWHLDPRAKVLEIFHRQEASWLLTHTFTGEEPVSAPPFDAITFPLSQLWLLDPPAVRP